MTTKGKTKKQYKATDLDLMCDIAMLLKKVKDANRDCYSGFDMEDVERDLSIILGKIGPIK